MDTSRSGVCWDCSACFLDHEINVCQVVCISRGLLLQPRVLLEEIRFFIQQFDLIDNPDNQLCLQSQPAWQIPEVAIILCAHQPKK